jgi:hypothetical protein
MKTSSSYSTRDSRSHRVDLHRKHVVRKSGGNAPRKENYNHDGVDSVIAFLGILTAGLFLYGVLNVIF